MLFSIKQRCSFENQNFCSHCKPKQERPGGGWGGEGKGEGSQAERGGRGMDIRGGVGSRAGVSQVQEILQNESKKPKHKKSVPILRSDCLDPVRPAERHHQHCR